MAPGPWLLPAIRINCKGSVAGDSYFANEPYHLFLVREGALIDLLSDLGLLGGHASRALGLNEKDQVVG